MVAAAKIVTSFHLGQFDVDWPQIKTEQEQKMKKFTVAALLIATVALSACNKNKYDNGDDAVDLNGSYGAGANGGIDSANMDPTSAGYLQSAIGDRVLFVVDQSSLTEEAKATLSAQANWLNSNSYNATIEGHADEQGTREYNLALGARRANAVREYLISQGVPANRLNTVSYGKERPLAVCSDESCYSQNRRAVTVITGGMS